MPESAKGDEELIELLSKLAGEIKNYAEIFLSVHENLDKSIIRLNALVHPTAENKLKAISLPPVDSISNNIKENIYDAKDKTKTIVSLLKKVEDIVNNSRIECSFCNGKGEISTQSYYRERETIEPFLETKKCSACNGNGYLDVSGTVVQLTIQLISGLKGLSYGEVKKTVYGTVS
jgi:hypothetical protein